MPTKPTAVFTCATDANFSSGPATGQPTKINPPGFPACAQGVAVPGDPTSPELLHALLNICGQWITDWLDTGSAAGAADAHLLETDANGDTAVQTLEAAGRVAQGWTHFRDDFLARSSPFSDHPDFWATGGTGTLTDALKPGGVARLTTGANSGDSRVLDGPNDTWDADLGFAFEAIVAVGSTTSIQVEIGMRDVDVDFATVSNGVIARYDTGAGDSTWTLAAKAESVLSTDAGVTAPSANLFQRVRVEVASDGSAELFVNGVSEASVGAGSVGGAGAGDVVDSYIWVETLTTAARVLEVDRYEVWQAPAA